MFKILKEVFRVLKNATLVLPLLEGAYRQIKETLKYAKQAKNAEKVLLKKIYEEEER